MDFQNTFSWSKSRHDKFSSCRRAYYFHYYGSFGGWEAPLGSEARELFILKKLATRWQWAGSVVHESLRQLLARARATGEFWSAETLLSRTRDRARAHWARSRTRSFRDVENPDKFGLLEHEYDEKIPAEDWRRLYDEAIEASLRAFSASEILQTIRATPPSAWLSVDELESWDFEGTKIWVAIDFAYRDAIGQTHILDWKTGAEKETDHAQVGIYTLFAQNRWGAAPNGVTGELVYLARAATRRSVEVDDGALDNCRTLMRTSIGAMKRVLRDPVANTAHIDDFAQTEDRDECKRCPFRRPCRRLE